MIDAPKWLLEEVEAYNMEGIEVPKVILDLGANIGVFTDFISKKYPLAKIYAYEPDPLNCEAFRRNINNPNIRLIEKAVRNKMGMSAMMIGDMSVTNGFYKTVRNTKETIPVECMSASDLPSADYIKIDVEGCEMEILPLLNLSGVNTLIIEYHFASFKDLIISIATKSLLVLTEHLPDSPNVGVLKFKR